MKRLTCFLIAVIFLFCLVGCKDVAQNFQKPVTFYYRTDPASFDSNQGILSAEIHEAAIYQNNTTQILNSYFSGPVSDMLVSPFPSGLTALSVTENDDTAVILLDDCFKELNGLDLSIACAALTMTVTQLVSCEYVDICVQTTADKSERVLILSVDDLYFLDHIKSQSQDHSAS